MTADYITELKHLINSLPENEAEFVRRLNPFFQYHEISILKFRSLLIRCQTDPMNLSSSEYQVLDDYAKQIGFLLPKKQEGPQKNKDKND